MKERKVKYQNVIDGVVDVGKIADNECQQVGGHFFSWLKNCLLKALAIDVDTARFCTREW